MNFFLIIINFISFKLFNINIIIVFATCLMVVQLSNAQKPNADFRQISVQEGLPDRVVTALHQDKDGYIWIGSNGQAIKYDNKNFKVFSDSTTRSYRFMQIISDSENKKWILAKNRHNYMELLIFNEDLNEFIFYDSFFKEAGYPEISNPRKFVETDGENFFILTDDGEIFEFALGTIKQVFQEESNNPIHNLLVLGQSGLLIHTSQHLLYQKPGQQTKLLGKLDFEDQLVLHADTVWVISADDQFGGLKYLSTNDPQPSLRLSGRKMPLSIEKRMPLKSTIWDKSSNTLWMFGETSFVNWDWIKEEIRDFSDHLNDYPLAQTIYCTLRDQNGQLWLGTGDGLFIYNQPRKFFTSYFTKEQTGEQISFRGITTIDSTIYANTYRGLLSVDMKTEKIDTILPFMEGHFLALQHDRSGNMWSGYSSHLKKIDIQTNVISEFNFPYPTLIKNRNWDIWEVFLDSNNKIWLGTEVGLAHFNEKNQQQEFYENPTGAPQPIKGRIYAINEFGTGLWISSLDGLYFFNPDLGYNSPYPQDSILRQFKGISFTHLHIDRDSVFWLATEKQGMIRWDRPKGEYRKFNVSNGLFDNNIHAVYEGNYNDLWLSSDNGIMRFDKETETVQHFTTSNGLPHNEFNKISHFQDKNGYIYFGGVMGLVRFHPDVYQDTWTAYSSELKLHAVKFLDRNSGKWIQAIDSFTHQSLHVDPEFSGFELEVNLMDFMENHHYAYKIEGLHSEWNYQTKPKILIAGLDYGKHKLLVKARNRMSHWLAPVEVSIWVKPPFYYTWWFITLSILLFFTVAIAVYKLRVSQIKKINTRLEEEVRERTLKIESDKILLEKQAKKLEEQERHKAAFYANISHDLRTPMTLIKGPFEHILQRSEDHEISNLAQMGIQHTEITLKLIDQLIELSKKEQLEEQVAFKTLDLAAYLKGLTLSFESLAETQQIGLSFWSDPEKILIESDPDLLEKIIYNLLSNAFKYTPNGGYIEVGIKLEGNRCGIIVKDSGIGISQKDLPFIFDRYFQAEASKSKSQGVGLGLSIVNELVKRLDGEITVESQLNQGTVFHINLPVKDNQSGYDSQADTLQIEYDLTTGSEDFLTDTYEEEPVENAGKIILIVDDIPAIRQYIRYNLGHDFRIFEADNGQEGLELARTHIPDLIICDVKMPLMDGYSFCKLVKEDVAVSHIPVILLTAMADMENKIKGLDAGAEDYLYKPFNSKELLLKVQNLLQHQEKLAAYYSKSLVNPSNSSSTLQLKPKEQHFLDDVTAKIHLHLDDENFSVVELSELMYMSRKNLHRKIKALTEQSPSLLIRSIRLSEAMKILKKGKYNISEVAFMVGFSSPAYFSKCFQEMYGVVPKEV